MLALTGTGLLVGLLTTFIAARVTADPIISVRHAVSDVAEGNLDVEVPVYDGSELGLLQSGFNQMVTGLRERERIRDLFGRHVGEDVAREALEREDDLGGETREVAVLFVDMTGSTELASSRPATEVVDLLNEFFGVVVETVDAHGGWVNKFEGDAALAVFGAPQEIDDPAGRALRAAREMSERLESRGRGGRGGDRGLLRRDRRGEHRRRQALRVHGDRRRRQRGGAALRSRQGARRTDPRLLSGDRGGGGGRGVGLGARRGGRAARTGEADPTRVASGLDGYATTPALARASSRSR